MTSIHSTDTCSALQALWPFTAQKCCSLQAICQSSLNCEKVFSSGLETRGKVRYARSKTSPEEQGPIPRPLIRYAGKKHIISPLPECRPSRYRACCRPDQTMIAGRWRCDLEVCNLRTVWPECCCRTTRRVPPVPCLLSPAKRNI